MFKIKPLNDGTKGFRFNVLGKKGLIRVRKNKNNGWNFVSDPCMTKVNMGKASLYIEHKKTKKILHQFAG